MSKSTNEHPNKLFRLSPARQTALLTVLLSLASLVSVPGLGQQVFYHLLGAGEVTVAFLTPSTAVNESVGSRHIWPVALNSWTKRRAIVLDGSTAPLANYPVLVKLDFTRVDYASVRPDGFDLRFADTAGNILSHEVESWVSGGTSWVWVKVPSLATFPARNQIYMYYGNAAAAQAQDSAGLWGTDHLQVLHLSGTTGAIANGVAVPASLGDAGTTQNGGSGMSYSAGVFGNAVTLDGVNDAITMGTSAALNFGANTPFSIAAFVKTTDAAGPLVVFRNSTLGNPVLGIYIGHNGASTDAGKATLLVRDGTSSTGYATLVGPLVNDGQWHLIAGDMTVLRHESADRFIARLIGAAAQTITTSGVAGDVSTRVGRLIVDKPSGSVTVVGDVMIHGIEHISGAVAFDPSANVVISHYDSSACSTLDVITPGNIQFPNVGINGCGPRSINGTLNVGGDLGIDLYFNAAGLRNGKIAVAGNYSLVRDENYSSSTEIEMVGGSDTTISIVSGYFNPGNLTVSKTAGAKVSLVSNVVVRNGSSDVAILSGELDLAGYSLTVGNASGTDNTLTIGAGATLRRSGGTYTAEAVVNNGQILP